MRDASAAIIFSLVGLYGALATYSSDVQAKVRTAMANLESGRDEGFSPELYKEDYTAAELAFMDSVKDLSQERQRIKVVSFVVSMECLRIGCGPAWKRSQNQDLEMALLSALTQESSPSTAGYLASQLRSLFLPSDLEKQGTQIREVAKRWDLKTNPQVYMLAAILPSATTESMALLLPSEQGQPSLYADCLKARFGDKEAEKRLMLRCDNLGESYETEIAEITDVLSCVPTEAMKKYLALGLRSDAKITLAGGAESAKRFLYADALARMFRDDGSFPIKLRNTRTLTDRELDTLEQWCGKELGVQYPKTPRVKVEVKGNDFYPNQKLN